MDRAFEALLVDEELADQVWQAWDEGEIGDLTAWVAWWYTVVTQMSEDRLT